MQKNPHHKYTLLSHKSNITNLAKQELMTLRQDVRQRNSVIQISAEALSVTESSSFQLKLRVINNLNNVPEVV